MTGPKVFAVISSAEVGGAERYFVTLLKGLAASGVTVFVAHPEGPMAGEYRAHAAKSWAVEMASLLSPRAVPLLASLMRRSGAELAHTHLWNADALGGLAARAAGLPAVSTVYGAYHLPVGVSGLSGLGRAALSRSYRSVYRGFGRLIALSDYIRRDLLARAGIKAEAGKIEVISPGFDEGRLASWTAARARPSARSRPRIINVANFFPIKGQEWLLRCLPRVLARYPEAECALAGDGPNRKALRALAEGLGVAGSVIFAGRVCGPALFDLFSRAHVFALPSLSEGLPEAILEAFALGVPVVASRAGGIPEIVEDGLNGLLVKPGNAEGLARALVAVLSDESLGARLAAAGRRTLTRFSQQAMAESTISVYREVLRDLHLEPEP